MYDKDNDISRIFYDDSREKKRVAVGIHNRASRLGYIRGGIKTQSDYLTPKQRRMLNGEVRVTNMYEEFKVLEKCDLNEILKRSDTEIKGILMMIKDNNTSSKISKQFKVSNGKLYSIYKQYGVPYGKDLENKEQRDISKKVITKQKFDIMDTIQKGEYIENIKNTTDVTIAELCTYWKTARNKLHYYINRFNDKGNKSRVYGNKNTKSVEVEKNVQAVENFNEEINLKDDILNLKIEELEKEKAKLLEHILAISKENATSKPNGLRVDINGEYLKDEISNRLLSLDNILTDNTKYRIEIHLEEIETIIPVKHEYREDIIQDKNREIKEDVV